MNVDNNIKEVLIAYTLYLKESDKFNTSDRIMLEQFLTKISRDEKNE